MTPSGLSRVGMDIYVASVTEPGGDAAHVSAGQLAAGLAGPHQPAVAGHRAHARAHRLAQPANPLHYCILQTLH